MKKEKGFSLLEVVIALALLGIVAVAFLGALASGSMGIFIADRRAAAESLARAAVEYVRSQEYSGAPWDYTVTSSQRSSTDQPTWWSDEVDNEKPPFLPPEYDGYTVVVEVKILAGHTVDDGIQKIEVDVKHHDDLILENLVSYRSLR